MYEKLRKKLQAAERDLLAARLELPDHLIPGTPEGDAEWRIRDMLVRLRRARICLAEAEDED